MGTQSTTEKDQHTDPVCDMTVSTDSEYSLHFTDKQYFFCSEHCMHKFKEHPEQYLDKNTSLPLETDVKSDIGVWIASLAGLGSAFTNIWNILRWPVIILPMMTALSALYRFASAIKLSWIETAPGAIAAAGAWVGVTLA